jgi:hypothetical protein
MKATIVPKSAWTAAIVFGGYRERDRQHIGRGDSVEKRGTRPGQKSLTSCGGFNVRLKGNSSSGKEFFEFLVVRPFQQGLFAVDNGVEGGAFSPPVVSEFSLRRCRA